MSEVARQKIFDLHFTGLCLFALWADGVLSSNERDYLTDLLWINFPNDVHIKYDFEFEARSRITDAIEVINQTYPELNSSGGSADTDEVAAALAVLLTKIEEVLDDTFSPKETEKFFSLQSCKSNTLALV